MTYLKYNRARVNGVIICAVLACVLQFAGGCRCVSTQERAALNLRAKMIVPSTRECLVAVGNTGEQAVTLNIAYYQRRGDTLITNSALYYGDTLSIDLSTSAPGGYKRVANGGVHAWGRWGSGRDDSCSFCDKDDSLRFVTIQPGTELLVRLASPEMSRRRSIPQARVYAIRTGVNRIYLLNGGPLPPPLVKLRPLVTDSDFVERLLSVR